MPAARLAHTLWLVTETTPAIRQPKRQSVRILLLEDDESFSALVHLHIRSMAIGESASPVATVSHYSGTPKLVSVATLKEALAELASRHFDLIIADLNVPDSSGLDTLRALRKTGERLILVLTGEEDSQTAAAAIERGAYDYLPKSQMNGATLKRLVRLATIQAATVSSLREGETRYRLLAEEQAAHVRYQAKVARFGALALAKRDPGELAAEALQTVLEGLCAEAVAYIEPAPGGAAELLVRAAVGLVEDAANTVSTSPAAGPLRQALSASEVALVEDGADLLPFRWAGDFRSAIFAPIRGEHASRGALCALGRSPKLFGSAQAKFVELVGGILSTGLQRIESELRAAFLAQYDPLTGLPNRTLLSDRFAQMIVQAKRRRRPLGVLFIDLDDFKLVNDTLGHAAGDALLKEVARRLQSCIRRGDTVARISGDEFAAVLDVARVEDAAVVAQKVIDLLSAPVQLDGHESFITASVGIAAFPADGDNAESLLAAADSAMYRAKESGRNSFQFFTSEINQRTKARAQISAELHHALEREEFELVFQAKYDLGTKLPCSAEALLRWKHPERGMIPPAQFIPLLEETGLIVPVGDWVLRRACDNIKRWQAAGMRPLPVAVNLSARQFRLKNLDAIILSALRSSGIDLKLIELEITESHLMQDPQHAGRVLRSLVDSGVRIAIDDFGTGYSSLSYLTRFPVSALKIDQSFVAGSLHDPAAAAIVRTIIDMAHTLGFIVVAEGVETEVQAAFLRKLGCDQAQGYLYSRPMPEQDFAKHVVTRHGLHEIHGSKACGGLS